MNIKFYDSKNKSHLDFFTDVRMSDRFIIEVRLYDLSKDVFESDKKIQSLIEVVVDEDLLFLEFYVLRKKRNSVKIIGLVPDAWFDKGFFYVADHSHFVEIKKKILYRGSSYF